MVRTIQRAVVTAGLLVFFGSGTAMADDIWELQAGDDGCPTNNELIHGASQTHDLAAVLAVADVDWALIQQKQYHSYEVRVANSNLNLATTPAVVNRVDCGGAVLTAGVPFDGTAQGAVGIRWIANATADTYVRVNPTALLTLGNVYTIQLLDSTYAVPRYNNTSTQVTVYLIQNFRGTAVTGSVYFFDPAGTLLHAEPINVGPNSLQVFATNSIPALNQTAGHALIAHDGGYGALAGKAVALEPATGFSFDTAFVAKPY
jgi:hypothetical protein